MIARGGVLAAGLLALGAAVLAVGALALSDRAPAGRDGGERDADQVGRDGTSAVAPQRIRFAAQSRYDLAKRRPASVRIAVPRAEAPTVEAGVVLGGGRVVPLAAPARVRAGGTRSLRLAVARAAARALAGCAPASLLAAVRDARGRVLTRRVQPLAVVPPACGRFFAADSVWNRPLPASAPVDPVSRELAGGLASEVEREFAAGYAPTINTSRFSTPVFIATADQRRVPVQLVGSRVSFGGAIAATLRAGVPIPPGARPAEGSDHHLVIYQPATDTMWELWGTTREGGRWQAQWGGRMSGVSRSPGYFTAVRGILPGATASSLPLVGGLITGADLARGRIDHALAMAVPHTRASVWTPPAQRTDGGSTAATAIPMGAHFRLDPKLDVDALRLPRLTAMMARAAQRYGIVVRDTAPVVAFVGQDPVSLASDPWREALAPSVNEVLKAFPWSHLQLMRMDPQTYGSKRVSSESLVAGGR